MLDLVFVRYSSSLADKSLNPKLSRPMPKNRRACQCERATRDGLRIACALTRCRPRGSSQASTGRTRQLRSYTPDTGATVSGGAGQSRSGVGRSSNGLPTGSSDSGKGSAGNPWWPRLQPQRRIDRKMRQKLVLASNEGQHCKSATTSPCGQPTSRSHIGVCRRRYCLVRRHHPEGSNRLSGHSAVVRGGKPARPETSRPVGGSIKRPVLTEPGEADALCRETPSGFVQTCGTVDRF